MKTVHDIVPAAPPSPELHLFVLWEKARTVEVRILEDLAREMEIVWTGEMAFTGDPARSYEAFYGARKPMDGTRKVRHCGGGCFRVIVVRDADPHYGLCEVVPGRRDRLYEANVKMYELKARYRDWAGRRHRVHGTTDREEFRRDVWLLTGHADKEWRQGVPEDIALNIPARPAWTRVIEEAARTMDLSGCRILLENKYINDVFYAGTCGGRPCIVKCSSKCPDSIANEYALGRRLFALAPTVVAEPLAVHADPAFVVTARVAGPSLTELLAQGLSAEQADRFAADIRTLARALRETGILHRDLFADNLLLDADGHLKAIDWQLAIERNSYHEDPWVARHWKFRYVVFGVNRELGLGVWNDFHALGKILARFPQTETVRRVAQELAEVAPQMTFAAPPKGLDRIRLWLYGCSLRVQMLLRGKRHRKYPQLLNRWRTVRCQW